MIRRVITRYGLISSIMSDIQLATRYLSLMLWHAAVCQRMCLVSGNALAKHLKPVLQRDRLIRGSTIASARLVKAAELPSWSWVWLSYL